MRWLLAVFVALMGAVSLAETPPATTTSGPPRIYLRHPTMTEMICAPTSTGWSCRPTAAVAAFLAGNARDDCGP